MQPGDGFSGPLFPRGGNNAGRDPDNRVALFLIPCADPALRAALSEKFLRQFFPTGRALPKTEHRKPHFKLSPGRAQAVWLRARSSRLRHILPQSPRAGGPAMMTLWWGFGRPGAHVARGLRYGGVLRTSHVPIVLRNNNIESCHSAFLWMANAVHHRAMHGLVRRHCSLLTAESATSMTPNDLKLSDGGGLAQPVRAKAAAVTARSGSLQRMVERSQRPHDARAQGRFQRVAASGVCRIGADCFKSKACLVNGCLPLRGFALANQILESSCV